MMCQLRWIFGLSVIILILTGCIPGQDAEPMLTDTPTQIPPTDTPTKIPPTVTPTPKPIVKITGKVLIADSNEPLPYASIMVTDADGNMEIDEEGRLRNPTCETDSSGNFEVVVPESYLQEQDNQIMILVSPKLAPKYYYLTDDEGTRTVLKIESVPTEIDLGNIFVH